MTSIIVDFLNEVASDHGLATGLKRLKSHYEIVQYANESGYRMSLQEWAKYHIQEWSNSEDHELDAIFRCEETHWSWAFRQNSTWRKLLIGGSVTDGMRQDFNIIAGNAEKRQVDTDISKQKDDTNTDRVLDLFIIEISRSEELKKKIKSCRNQDEVIDIARDYGFEIDSMSILKKWSRVTDFTKPTWFGWFKE